MIRYEVRVDGEEISYGSTTYSVVATNPKSAKMIAFMLDGGLARGQKIIEEGDYSLACMYCDITNKEKM